MAVLGAITVRTPISNSASPDSRRFLQADRIDGTIHNALPPGHSVGTADIAGTLSWPPETPTLESVPPGRNAQGAFKVCMPGAFHTSAHATSTPRPSVMAWFLSISVKFVA